MKYALTLLVAIAVVFSCVAVKAAIAAEKEKSVVRHVVLFKFKDGTTPEQIKAVEQAFAELPKKIEQIKGFEWGTNISPENMAQGFTHCFFVTFDNEAARDAYLPHPAHKEFASKLQQVDKVLVIDYKTH